MSEKLGIEELTRQLLSELPTDPLSTFQIVSAARRYLHVQSEDDVVGAVRQVLRAIVSRGARPLDTEQMNATRKRTGKPVAGLFLRPDLGPEELVDWIVDEWRSSGKDPDLSDSRWLSL